MCIERDAHRAFSPVRTVLTSSLALAGRRCAHPERADAGVDRLPSRGTHAPPPPLSLVRFPALLSPPLPLSPSSALPLLSCALRQAQSADRHHRHASTRHSSSEQNR
eukprot:1953587-Rhodomonas_salina.3